MASYTVVTSTAANVAGANNLNSTKVRVVANTTCVYAIDAPATITSNVGQIPQNVITYINMGGIGKKLSVLPAGGANAVITVTECGTVYQSALNQNVLKGVFTMTTGNATIVGTTAGLGILAGMYVTGGNITGNPTVSTVNSGNIVLSSSTGIGSNVTATLTFSVNPILTA
jgi:hypothetical protein